MLQTKQESITIKDLYKWALANNVEDALLFFYNPSFMRYYPLNYIEKTCDGKEVYVS